jgi:hypothetical protein
MTPIGIRLGSLGGQIADALLDRQIHLDRHVVRVQRHDRQVGVDDLDVGGLLDVGGGDQPAPLLMSLSWTGCVAKLLRRSFLTLRTIWVTSSFTPGCS